MNNIEGPSTRRNFLATTLLAALAPQASALAALVQPKIQSLSDAIDPDKDKEAVQQSVLFTSIEEVKKALGKNCTKGLEDQLDVFSVQIEDAKAALQKLSEIKNPASQDVLKVKIQAQLAGAWCNVGIIIKANNSSAKKEITDVSDKVFLTAIDHSGIGIDKSKSFFITDISDVITTKLIRSDLFAMGGSAYAALGKWDSVAQMFDQSRLALVHTKKDLDKELETLVDPQARENVTSLKNKVNAMGFARLVQESEEYIRGGMLEKNPERAGYVRNKLITYLKAGRSPELASTGEKYRYGQAALLLSAALITESEYVNSRPAATDDEKSNAYEACKMSYTTALNAFEIIRSTLNDPNQLKEMEAFKDDIKKRAKLILKAKDQEEIEKKLKDDNFANIKSETDKFELVAK